MEIHGDHALASEGGDQSTRHLPTKSTFQQIQEYFFYDITKGSPEISRNTLLVVAVLIMTATHQAVLSPPGGLWQEDSQPVFDNNTGNLLREGHGAGKAVMGTKDPWTYGVFLTCNSFGFFMSLHMMFLLTNGFPIQFELTLALVGLLFTYEICLYVILPPGLICLAFTIFSLAAMPFVVGYVSKIRNRKARQTRG